MGGLFASEMCSTSAEIQKGDYDETISLGLDWHLGYSVPHLMYDSTDAHRDTASHLHAISHLHSAANSDRDTATHLHAISDVHSTTNSDCDANEHASADSNISPSD